MVRRSGERQCVAVGREERGVRPGRLQMGSHVRRSNDRSFLLDGRLIGHLTVRELRFTTSSSTHSCRQGSASTLGANFGRRLTLDCGTAFSHRLTLHCAASRGRLMLWVLGILIFLRLSLLIAFFSLGDLLVGRGQVLLRHGRIGSLPRWIDVPNQGHSELVHRHSMRTRNEHVFWLQVGVNDATDPMQVVQTNERVGRNLAHNLEGDTFEVVSLDQGKQIGTHGFKHHAHVLPVWPKVLEIVGELHHTCERHTWEDVAVWAALCGFPVVQAAAFRGLRKQLDLVVGSFRVVRGALLDLHRHEPVCILHVLAQPHGGEVPPSELGDDEVLSVVDFPDSHHMVPSLAVAVRTLIVTLHVVLARYWRTLHRVVSLPALRTAPPPEPT
mmetsp:Transcript_60913/g.161766  ORF Transcript_60913/g.161766 Transcript_60913/m.161766 type:complete len:385 (+) Transcript_60913:1025-2179(+)